MYQNITTFYMRFLCFIALFLPSITMADSLVDEWGWFPAEASWVAAESQGFIPVFKKQALTEQFASSLARPNILVQDQRLIAMAAPAINPLTPTDLPPNPTAPVPPGFFTLRGEVAEGVDALEGVDVFITNLKKSTRSAANGSFAFETLPTGNHSVEVFKLGYEKATQSFTALPGQTINLRFDLKKKSIDGEADETMLEDEVVVGEYQEESQGDFNLDIVTDSPNIIAGLSKDDLSRTGSSDAGAAVSKIAGANIVGGRYAVVRGLGDRYSNTLFNGALIPSADPTKKAVQLDLFPSDLLESVAITKLFLPELPAEFAGGTVQIQTLRMPKEPIVEFSYGTKWFERRADGLFLGDSKTNIGLREMNYPTLPTKFTQPNGFTGTVQDSLEMHLSAPMRPSAVDEEQAQSMSMVLGNTYEMSQGIRLGTVLAITQGTEHVYQSLNIGRGYRAFGATPTIDNTRNIDDFDRNLTFGVMSSLSMELGDKHEVGFTYFLNDSNTDSYTRTFNSRSRSLDPIYTANPFGVRDPATGEIIRAFATPVGNSDYFEPLQRSLTSNQFNGKHVIYGEKSRGAIFSWMVSDATAVEERPHSRTYSSTTLDFADEERIAPLATFNPSDFRPEFGQYTGAGDPILISGFPFVNVFRETLKTEDRGGNRRADVTLPFYFDDQTDDHIGIRFGYNTSDRSREVRGRFYSYDFSRINDRLLIEDSLGNYQGNYGQLFHDAFNNGTFPGTVGTPFFGNQGIIINDFSGNGATIRNIDAGSAVESFYVGSDFASGGWTISGGARIESESRQYQILPGLNPNLIANPKPVIFEYETILPGMVITRSMGEKNKHTVTAGWSQTVARPTFYEFAPAFIVDQATGDVTRGNPNLVNSSITNYDLRYDYKITENTTFGIGLFSKDVEKPIVDAFDTVLSAQSWINGDSGTLNGVETEFNTKIDRYRIGGNYTFIDSSLQYSLQNKQITTGFSGQPEHIFNLIAGYDLEDYGLSTNLIYNFTGEFMSQAPTAATAPAIMEEAFKTLDFNVQKSFELGNCDGKVTFAARNILDSTRRQYFDGTAFTFREVQPGRIYSLSCELTF